MKNHLTSFFAWANRAIGSSQVKRVQRVGKLCCETCGGSIHRHDKYTIAQVRHIDCQDSKLVGQESLRLEIK